jgi:hypothetical protein
MSHFDHQLLPATNLDARFKLNGIEYVIVRSEVFDQMKELLEADHDDLRLMLARSMDANGWNEPGMDAYDSYPKNP